MGKEKEVEWVTHAEREAASTYPGLVGSMR